MKRLLSAAVSFTLLAFFLGNAAPAQTCRFNVSANSTSSSTWTSACRSTHRSGRYARFYTFTVSGAVSFQADLTSSTDAYLLLLAGSGTGGSVIAQNDDFGGTNNSRITRTLSPGTYTLEATTYSSGATGSFTLTLQTAGGGSCQVSVSANSTSSGSWTSACASAHRSGKYAKYYSFTVSDTVSFQADLVSATDAYLLLLAGSGSGSSVIAENDDFGGSNNSRITQTLSPGTYTIKATTYSSGATGSFTLTLQATGGGSCQFSVSANSVSSGSWTSACASAHRSGRYAKYYTFTISESVNFQADLASETDAYIFLLAGSGSSGSVIAENDDFGGNNSRINQTLLAGTYTIEATTYNSGTTGSFTLTLQAAGGGCQVSVSANSVTSGTWISACGSAHRAGSYAKYYTFTVSGTVSFQADLVSATDPYLILIAGGDSGGPVIAQNDDFGGSNNSRISQTLSPGTYTIEATTYNTLAAGSFALTLQTSGGGGGGGGNCQVSVSADSASSGSWTSACTSTHRSGKYAKYYTFTVSDTVSFQADLVSATNAYLFLLSGSSSGGSVIAENDDFGGSNNSRITRTLSPGTYTMEATTYNSGATGAFTLILQTTAPLACLIFVHGSREADADSGYDWSSDWRAGRDYWRERTIPHEIFSDPRYDFIRAATDGRRPFYVVRYNGAAAWSDNEASGQVAREIVRATEGLSDDDNNHCTVSAAGGGFFWVITHSGGANVIDYILGNSRPSDPHYNDNGPFDQAASRISAVISVGGAHRGTPAADIICNPQDPRCFQLGKNCTPARRWLQTADAFQVKQEANSPLKTIWLTGGYKGTLGSCVVALPGEDDTVLSYASQFACGGSALQDYGNGNVCRNNAKQESSNFRNLDAVYEDHDDEKNNWSFFFDRERRSIPDGIWLCDGQPCAANTRVQADMSTADFVNLLLGAFGRTQAREFDLPSLSRATGAAYLAASRFPRSSSALEEGHDPILRDQTVTRNTALGPEGEEPSLTAYPKTVSFEAPEPVVLQAYLRERGKLLAAAHLSATIRDVKGRLVEILDFRDDGEGGDLISGDHLYTALLTPPIGQERSFAGVYDVSVQATTTDGISRAGTSAFRYSSPDARLTGRFSDRLIGGSLQIRAQVEVTSSGRFHLEGTLYTTDGRSLAWAQEARHLNPGRHWIPLNFYGLALREKGFDGPYVLRHLALSTTTRVPSSPSRVVENAHVTAAYRATDFTNRPFNDPELLKEAARLLQAPEK